ncbi:MAG: flippase-like domain-containing protein [Candidatus Eremiobacteraeota bacterium]|nr:flippase-like domain-containing protein [Candidatus Eremiobacteraeota bacterium]
MKRRTVYNSLVAFGITVLIFYLLFKAIRPAAVLDTFNRADLSRVPWLLVPVLLNMLAPTDKWRRILRALGCKISFSEMLTVMMGCIPLKLVIPGKIGELARAFYLSSRKKFLLATGVGVIAFNKVLILMALCFFVLIGRILAALSPVWMGLAGTVLLVVILWGLDVPFGMLISRSKGESKFGKILQDMGKAFVGLSRCQRLGYFFYTLFSESNFVITALLLFWIFHVKVPFPEAVSLAPLAVLIGQLPIGISGFGTREAAFLVLFQPWAGSDTLLAVALAYSFVEYILPSIIGLFFMPKFLTGLPPGTLEEKGVT